MFVPSGENICRNKIKKKKYIYNLPIDRWLGRKKENL